MRTKVLVVSVIVITLTVIGTRVVSRSSDGPALQQARPVILTATVDFSQELHARPSTSPTTGVGAGVIVLSADRQSVSYAFSFTGLTGPATVAHFHGAANFGANAGVVRDLCGTSATPPCQEGRLISGTWSKTDVSQALTDPIIDALLAGQIYLNIHTQVNPGGEIRGQVIPISPK